MSFFSKRFSVIHLLVVALVCLALVRLAMMALLPLADTTESRYGEIARLTLEQSHWLMPHVTPEQPFLGKPPGSTWLSASSAGLLGLHEFALRLPSFLLLVAVLMMVWMFARQLSHPSRYFGLFVASASPVYFVSAGTVMTDSLHLASVTLALLCAWRSIDADSRAAVFGFWLACAIGLLAKGLASLALIALPLGLYALLGGGIWRVMRALLKPVPILMFFAIAVPWYALAEQNYPGFLEYFFIGEHFKRFTEPGWSGDQFGEAHQQPRGWIWVLWLLAILPWVGLFLSQGARQLRLLSQLPHRSRFLWAAVLAPLIFFTFAGNILWTYCLTAVPPFAVLAACWFEEVRPRRQRQLAITSLVGVLVLAPALAWVAHQESEQESDRSLIQAHIAARGSGMTPLIVAYPPQHSTFFYSRRDIQLADSAQAQHEALRQPGAHVAVSARQVKQGLLQGIDYQILYANRRATLLRVR